MFSSDTNKTKTRGSWKKFLLFSFTLLRLMAVPALNALDSSSGTSFSPAAFAVCDCAKCPISTDLEFRNARGRSPRMQHAGESR